MRRFYSTFQGIFWFCWGTFVGGLFNHATKITDFLSVTNLFWGIVIVSIVTFRVRTTNVKITHHKDERYLARRDRFSFYIGMSILLSLPIIIGILNAKGIYEISTDTLLEVAFFGVIVAVLTSFMISEDQ
ncbi:hypothetical protein [Listeria costaricensis]|uniref:hypothetical protein n=1 Tax=Listeria costaricensis TaxID=2026604 RepID=UPI000C08C8ED|nr:hypothetical protein [Listeria costaricensis]